MLYTILCYNNEERVASWSKEEDDAVMEKLLAVQEKMARKGKLGPVARLHAGGEVKTVRKDRAPHFVTDGPFAETKEQILGFYIVDCESQNEAVEFAQELGSVNPGGAYEIRPVMYFDAGRNADRVVPNQAGTGSQ